MAQFRLDYDTRMRLTQEQAESIKTMTSTQQGQIFLRWLGEVAETENRAFIGAREFLPRHQGRVQMVTQIMETILEVDSAVEAYRQPQT